MNKNEYEILFDDFLDIIEFDLIKYKDGWGVIDRQGANIGNIESERFEDACQLIDRLDSYIDDYLVTPIEDCLKLDKPCLFWADLVTIAKHNGMRDSKHDVLTLDMICNHSTEVNLENCEYYLDD